MHSKIKVMVRPGIIRSRRVCLLYFLYNEKLILKIKTKYNAQWCAELKCWWVHDRNNFIQELKLHNDILILVSRNLFIDDNMKLTNFNKHRWFRTRKFKNSKFKMVL